MQNTQVDFLINATEGVANSGVFQSDAFLAFFWIIKFIFLTLAVIFFLHIIYLIFKINTIQGEFKFYKDLLTKKNTFQHKGEFAVKWRIVKERAYKIQEAEYKLAIIEADKLFDDLLKKMNLKGNDMGERLKNINNELLPSIDRVWKSHKIRNKIAHEPDFHLSYNDAQDVIKNYEVALYELKILD
ncbi:MAG: hypothetical protein AAB614_00135 [Patescibacteria group bacterium]